MGVYIVTSPESSEEMMNYAVEDISSQSRNNLATTAVWLSLQSSEENERKSRERKGPFQKNIIKCH